MRTVERRCRTATAAIGVAAASLSKRWCPGQACFSRQQRRGGDAKREPSGGRGRGRGVGGVAPVAATGDLQAADGAWAPAPTQKRTRCPEWTKKPACSEFRAASTRARALWARRLWPERCLQRIDGLCRQPHREPPPSPSRSGQASSRSTGPHRRGSGRCPLAREWSARPAAAAATAAGAYRCCPPSPPPPSFLGSVAVAAAATGAANLRLHGTGAAVDRAHAVRRRSILMKRHKDAVAPGKAPRAVF